MLGLAGSGREFVGVVVVADQAGTYLKFERRATGIVDVEPLLVPGLLQTPDYYREMLTGLGVLEEDTEGWITRRLGRQAILSRPQPPNFLFVVSELALRQPLGGHAVMARQVRRLAEESERPNISVRVLPATAAAHPALHGAFVVLEFAEEPAVVYLEGWMSGLFPENPKEVAQYTMATERLTRLALDEPRSLELLRTIAEDLERAR